MPNVPGPETGMTELYLGAAIGGWMVFALGLFSRATPVLPMPEPLLALAVGIVLGPQVLGLFHPRSWGTWELWLEDVSRFVLAVGLMSVALRVGARDLLDLRRAVMMLLFVGLPATTIVSAVIAGAAFNISWWEAATIGAIVSPTDPVVASSIITGPLARERLPRQLRQLISAESGLNDGLALPLVLLPVLFHDASAPEAVERWVVHVLLWEVVAAALAGYALGRGAASLLRRADRRGAMSETALLASTLALSLAVLGTTRLLGMDGLLAVFMAGIGFVRIAETETVTNTYPVQEALNRFITLPVFALFGMLLPWHEWRSLGYPLIAGGVGILLLRRLPIIFALRRWLGPAVERHSALFLGWFGPIGVGAIFYATLTDLEETSADVFPFVSFVITLSLVAHGLSGAPLTRRFPRQLQGLETARDRNR